MDLEANMFSNRFRWIVIFLQVTMLCASAQSVGIRDGRLPTTEERLKRHNVSSNTPALVDALRNPNPEVRYLAAQKLAEDKNKEAIPEIARALDSETVPATQITIAFALAQLGDTRGFVALSKSCDDQAIRASLRVRAAGYLLNLNDESCLKAVMAVLRSDVDFDSRMLGLSLLGRFHHVSDEDSKSMCAAAVQSLNDPTPAVRISASTALVALGNPAAIPALERAVDSEMDQAVKNQMKSNLERLQQSHPPGGF
jgi:HEAT repeat protein